MHPAQWMLRTHHVLRAPENDDGFEDMDEVTGDELLDEDASDEQDELDEGEGGEDEVDDSEDEDPPQHQPTRGENRVARATREAAEAKREAEAARRELAQLQAQVQQRSTTPAESPEQRAARLDAMDPYARLEYLHREGTLAMEARMSALQFKLEDQADKATYDSLCARAPVAEKYRKDVEDRLAQMRAGGTTAPRETVLRWVIGDKALADAGRATGRARKTADTNRQRQTARPPAGRGDTQGDEGRRGGDSPEARMKRLENMKI